MDQIRNRQKEYEELYKGKEVMVLDGAKQFYGVLEKIEENRIYLNPSIVFHNFPSNKKGEWDYNPVLNNETPTTFPITPNTAFQAFQKGYLENLVKSYNNWKEKNPNKIILP